MYKILFRSSVGLKHDPDYKRHSPGCRHTKVLFCVFWKIASSDQGGRLQWDQPQLPGTDDGLRAAPYVEFAVNVAGVALDSIERNHQLLGDLTVRATIGDQSQNFQLGWSQRRDQGRGSRG